MIGFRGKNNEGKDRVTEDESKLMYQRFFPWVVVVLQFDEESS
jgi:hypothetical protein